jgi:hypothetical protein
MQIEIGKHYVNKTWKYLRPCLRSYGPTFKVKFDGLFKLAVGIHDSLLDGTSFEDRKLFYILFNRNYKPVHYSAFMHWVSHQEYYVIDYAMDDALTGYQHMLVLEFPEKYVKAYDFFIKGRYSLMYNLQEQEMLFEKEDAAKEILNKTKVARLNFVELVNKSFRSDITELDLLHETAEMDFPFEKNKEYFNYMGE